MSLSFQINQFLFFECFLDPVKNVSYVPEDHIQAAAGWCSSESAGRVGDGVSIEPGLHGKSVVLRRVGVILGSFIGLASFYVLILSCLFGVIVSDMLVKGCCRKIDLEEEQKRRYIDVVKESRRESGVEDGGA